MNKKRILHICLVVLRGAVLSACALALTQQAYNCFCGNENLNFPRPVGGIIALIFCLLIYNSFALATHRYDKYIGGESPKYGDRSVKFGKLLLSSADLYIELFIIAAGVVLFPTPGPSSIIDWIFFGGVDKRPWSLLIILPLLLGVDFAAWYRTCRNRRPARKTHREGMVSGKKERKKLIPPVVANVLIVFFLYLVGMVAFALLAFYLVFLWDVLKGVYIGVLLAVLAFYSAFFFRAVSRRRKLIKKIKQYSKNNSVHCSKIKRPYASLFLQRPGYDFFIEVGEKCYECKFISAVFPWTPIIFSENGGQRNHTVRLFRVELFHFLTKIDYTWESEHKKILVAAPIPSKIYKQVKGAPLKEADTGEHIGEYTVYNSTGFLGALERDIL